MLNPIVHIRLFIILMDGILQFVGARTILAGRMIQAYGYRDIEMGMDEGDGFNILANSKNSNRSDRSYPDVVKLVVHIGLIYEERKEGNLLNPHNPPY